MLPYVFISYRRSDAAQTARALHFQLRLRFGLRQIFMDVNAIQPGEAWPDRVRRALDKSTVVLVLLGPSWLTTADCYGRRRLDDPQDWVHQELSVSLAAAEKTVIPLCLNQLGVLPPADALPAPLAALPLRQGYELRDECWDQDVRELGDRLRRDHGFIEVEVMQPKPVPEIREAALDQDQLDQALATLPRWEPVESMILQEYPSTRHEIRRVFRFNRFTTAIEFIARLGPVADQLKHHPRIENQWHTVIVGFTTWDVGNRITALDIKAAEAIDRVYDEVVGSQ